MKIPGNHTTYWQSTRNPHAIRVCHNTNEEMDAYGMDYDRITRERYRQLKRLQRTSEGVLKALAHDNATRGEVIGGTE